MSAQESADGSTWISDPEMPAAFSNVTTVAVILVLDTTTSLGADGFAKLQTYAKAAVDNINVNTSGKAQIGLVSFNNAITTKELTTDYSSLKTAIDGYTMGAQTKLFDAIDSAFTAITASTVTAKSKALIVFTDGQDNASTTITQTALVQKLQGATTLKTFAIGVGALADASMLTSIAVNGNSSIATDINAASAVFSAFSGAVSNVYTITYSRPQKTIVANWRRVQLIANLKQK